MVAHPKHYSASCFLKYSCRFFYTSTHRAAVAFSGLHRTASYGRTMVFHLSRLLVMGVHAPFDLVTHFLPHLGCEGSGNTDSWGRPCCPAASALWLQCPRAGRKGRGVDFPEQLTVAVIPFGSQCRADRSAQEEGSLPEPAPREPHFQTTPRVGPTRRRFPRAWALPSRVPATSRLGHRGRASSRSVPFATAGLEPGDRRARMAGAPDHVHVARSARAQVHPPC